MSIHFHVQSDGTGIDKTYLALVPSIEDPDAAVDPSMDTKLT
jgi:hypothetical protein